MLLYLTVILSLCVICDCTKEETEFSGNQAGRLRQMWLLSMRETKREKGKIKLIDQNKSACFIKIKC